MITDLFSHKIHSSGDDWPDKLTELAAIFGEFDGQPFDRKKIVARLKNVSSRVSYLAHGAKLAQRDPFRDEISAYPAYLGLYFLEQSVEGWVVRVSETAKQFLLREDPDVGSFLRLQLPLLQYPNGMGAAYTSFTNELSIKPNVRDRTLEFISEGAHLSPVRLIAAGLKADAKLRDIDVDKATLSFREIYGLANHASTRRSSLPSLDDVAESLANIRLNGMGVPEKFERRFHLLRHTEIFALGRGRIALRKTVSEADRIQLLRQLDAIAEIDNQFNDFDNCTVAPELEAVIASGEWGRYFDGVKVLSAGIVNVLTNDQALASATVPLYMPTGGHVSERQLATDLYEFRERRDGLPAIRAYNRQRELADPEATRIKMQRRNLTHKELIDKMDARLRLLGARPQENDHVDLFAKIPRDGSFIFEMKSGGDSILEQIRKGLSQLYEYRFRYRPVLCEDEVSLCLVLPNSPGAIPWMIEYLSVDREINVCWFDEEDRLVWPASCATRLSVLALE